MRGIPQVLPASKDGMAGFPPVGPSEKMELKKIHNLVPGQYGWNRGIPQISPSQC